MIRSPNDDTDFFDVITGVFQGYYIYAIFVDNLLKNVLRMSMNLMKEIVSHKNNVEKEYHIPQKKWRIQTMLTTLHFSEINLHKANSNCID